MALCYLIRNCWSFISCQILVFLFLFGSICCLIPGAETDRASLFAFKSQITHDPSGALRSWNETSPVCQWQGITCSQRHQRVTVLDLQSLKLAGSISPHIGNLSFLRKIDLAANEFTQEIPQEIGQLKRLQEIHLRNNSLGGSIPRTLLNCSSLTWISFGYNQLVGGIPSELSSLTKLQFFSVYVNNLTGTIPPSLGNLSSLTEFDASFNYLDGTIPHTLGNLKSFQSLILTENKLSGMIPHSLFNLSSIITIDVTYNELEGHLPSDLFATLPNLQDFSIDSNNISGSMPLSISNATNLEWFQAGGNQLYGIVPSLGKLKKLNILTIAHNSLGNGRNDNMEFLASLVNASDLQFVQFQENLFGGVLPEVISNFSTSLIAFSLESNQISGRIPSGIGNLVKLERLHMSNNHISGNIPPSIGKLKNLKLLSLSNNRLTGNVPSFVGNMTQLIKLQLDNNNLDGSIPSSLSLLQHLIALNLSKNNLSGTIPSGIFTLSSLSISLDLSRNKLIGPLPIEIGSLRNLNELDVSENMLYGEIPTDLGSCTSLQRLLMAGNNFQGVIPSSLSSLRGMEKLDISRNNLSGEIPTYLVDFSALQALNLSYNNFEGALPGDGIFVNTSIIDVDGNEKLCGGPAGYHLPNCFVQKFRNKKWSLSKKLVVSIISAVSVTTLLALLFFFLLHRRTITAVSVSSSSKKFLLTLSYQDLVKATDGFSESKLIGNGAFGSVYKGLIDEGRTVVAVKVFNLLKQEAAKSFLAECEALRNIRHRNLAKVLTACSGVDNRSNDFKALVYDYKDNGSLEIWLHPNANDVVHQLNSSLNLLQRLNIAINVAWALEYLHHQCEATIVHCDLKPSNILLDKEMTAYVGDFGLAKFLANDIIQSQTSSIGIRGTTGYVAPEYGIGSEVSTSGDVYSYGILILEMFIGKRPTDEMFNDSLNMRSFARLALSGQVEEIVDPMLLLEVHERRCTRNENRFSKMKECLVSIFQVGLACSAELPKERMDIGDIVAELTSIRDKLLKD